MSKYPIKSPIKYPVKTDDLIAYLSECGFIAKTLTEEYGVTLEKDSLSINVPYHKELTEPQVEFILKQAGLKRYGFQVFLEFNEYIEASKTPFKK